MTKRDLVARQKGVFILLYHHRDTGVGRRGFGLVDVDVTYLRASSDFYIWKMLCYAIVRVVGQ